jgi:hypothetical protein
MVEDRGAIHEKKAAFDFIGLSVVLIFAASLPAFFMKQSW